MLKRRLLAVACLLSLCISARAQFFTSGEERWSVQWRSISSSDFKIIYPEGLDSLALQYGLSLERWKAPVSRSIGFAPNENYRKPLPVILRAYTAEANGTVVWTPRRMELFTGPSARQPEALPWMDNLAIHESRHATQMQFTRQRGFGLYNLLVGELFPGAMAALYPGPALFEGDAVATETALSASGRGRSADFLEYYRACFAEGQMRDAYRWRWDSQKLYTPDYYRAGYLLVAGARYLYDEPYLAKGYYDNIAGRKAPFPTFNLQYTLKKAGGGNVKQTWREIASAQQEIWEKDEAARGPFTPSREITAPGRRFTQYLGPSTDGEYIFAIRHSITATPRLVKIAEDGRVSTLRTMSPTASDVRYSPATGRLYWSESVSDPRWSKEGSSRIYSVGTSGGSRATLTGKGRFYNPSPAEDDEVVAVVEYPVTGGSAIVVLDGVSGRQVARYPAPDFLQVVESAWVGGHIAASAISEDGFGIYVADEGYRTLLAPAPAKIKQLRSYGGQLHFVSDRLGVNELYRLDGEDVFQLTNNRLGASEFLPEGDSLTFAVLSPDGRMLRREALAEGRRIQYDSLYRYPVAEKLSEQERQIAGSVEDAPEGSFSSPARYSRLTHLVRIHSWAPAYVNYDEIADLSFDSLTSDAGLGATVFFQNDLSTSYGYASYGARRIAEDDLSVAKWRNTFHGSLTFSGLYPIIELSADIGERDSRHYSLLTTVFTSLKSSSLVKENTSSPYVKGQVKVYVPLSFSSGGWYRGVVPQVNLDLSNDLINTTDVLRKYFPLIGNRGSGAASFAGADPGRVLPLSRLTASLRGYTMLGTASSGIYPRWGIGAEAGISIRPGLGDLFSPNAYTYLYGYVPGFMDTHGIRLSATTQIQMSGRFAESYLKAVPRGLSAVSGIQEYIRARYPVQSKFTADYALPVLPVDWSGLGPVAYVRNFEIKGHFDYGHYSGSGSFRDGGLYSVGGSLCVRLANLLWIPYDTRIGVSYSFNGGFSWEDMVKNGVVLDRHRIGMEFSIDL